MTTSYYYICLTYSYMYFFIIFQEAITLQYPGSGKSPAISVSGVAASICMFMGMPVQPREDKFTDLDGIVEIQPGQRVRVHGKIHRHGND